MKRWTRKTPAPGRPDEPAGAEGHHEAADDEKQVDADLRPSPQRSRTAPDRMAPGRTEVPRARNTPAWWKTTSIAARPRSTCTDSIRPDAGGPIDPRHRKIAHGRPKREETRSAAHDGAASEVRSLAKNYMGSSAVKVGPSRSDKICAHTLCPLRCLGRSRRTTSSAAHLSTCLQLGGESFLFV